MNLRRHLNCSVAAMAVLSVLGLAPAAAQAPAEGPVEAVTVSGSRIAIQGYEAPTPVTVLNIEQLERNAHISIAESIIQLPSVGLSATPSNSVSAGNLSQGDASLSTVNLRNLGIARTLILFDGQRVVSSNILNGGVDLTTIPSELIQRVDVVTGGASAAYGSDAVGGVVNLILNKKFTGIKAHAEFGDSSMVQHQQMKAAVTVGWDMFGGRGHMILSADHLWSDNAVFAKQARWYNNGAIVQNPKATATNGLPYYIHVRNTGQSQFTEGGLIRGNTAGGVGSSITANSLAGTQFINDGQAVPFNFGTIAADRPAVCYNGCSGNAQNQIGALLMLAVPYHTTTAFAYGSYDLTPNVTASLQLNYGILKERNSGQSRQSTLTIPADNAYLPASIANQFGTLSNGYNALTGAGGTITAPTQSISLGTLNINNLDLNKPFTVADVCNTVAEPCLRLSRALARGVFTLEGHFGDWSWNTYFQHSQLREHQVADVDNYGPRYNFAVDAVKVTATNRGTSNLPIGSIQCRARIQGNPDAAGCVPLNLFGNGVASQEAIIYVNPGRDPSSGILNREIILLNQTVMAASMQGVLPWGLPAGNIAVAFGGEWRHEQASQSQVDPVNLIGNPWPAGNFKPYAGQYSTREGFFEADVPLLKDDVVQSLNLNAAGRITDYSTSGLVETWKLGLTTQIDDNIKLRGTWSLDIRAPLISDLFSPGTIGVGTVEYPPGTAAYQVNSSTGGNPALQPEKAVTTSIGVVLTPQFIPGLSMSLDWYSINIHGGIFSTGGQTIINRCLQGETVYCQFLLFSPTQFGGTKPYQINQIPANASSIKTSGFDLQANYIMDLWDGALAWSLVGNHTIEQTQTAIGITYDSAGALGSPLSYASNNVPKTRGTLSATYTEGPWSGTVQGRFLGGAHLTNGVQNLPATITRASLGANGVLTQGVGNGNLLDTNDVNPVGYLDLRLSYQWDDRIQMYGAVDNVTSVPRPQDGSNAIYDILGRTWRVGIRFKQ